MKNNSEEYKKEVIDVLHKIAKDKGSLALFVRDILTPREFEALGKRWQIVKRLSKGETHHSIAGDLGLGVSTVTRGSREMRKKEGGFHRALRLLGLEK